MIDLNFEPQILRILDMMPSSNLRPENPELIDEKKVYRQTIMFSATMPLKVEMLAKKYLRQAVFISIGDRKGKVNTRIEQRVEWMTEGNKRRRLLELLTTEEAPFIVFSNSKKQCDNLAKILDAEGHRCMVIHGGKIQEQREANLDSFKAGEVDVLIATDVVGRGIDIQGVRHVINYDMPASIDKYTHRIGRTGRAGLTGIATSFLTNEDTEIMYDLKEMLRTSGTTIPAELARHDAAQQKPGSVSKKQKSRIVYAKNT